MKKTMNAEVASSEVKASWHEYLDRVAREHETIVVTRYGRPIAKLVPHEEAAEAGLFGALAGSVQVHGDIVQPLGEAWDADA